MKNILLGFCFLPLCAVAQTGPGGVDNNTNNVLWLKADAGTNTTVNNGAISSWADQSGNGNDVSQSTANLQPLYKTSSINGFPALSFDNVTNTNDKLTGPDSPVLDNTTGLTILTITVPQNLNGEARTIVSKRTDVSINESYMFFYYSGNKIHTDIESTNNRFTTTSTFSNNNTYLIDLLYDGTLSSSSRSKVYKDGALDVTATESSSSIADNASPLVVGSTHSTDGRPFGGLIAEIIIYRKALNIAEHIIVDNYLAAKYNITLSANDYYTGDNSGNGDYDYEVAGVGTDASGSNTSFDPVIAGGLGITQHSGFGNGDYLIAGHASGSNSLNTTDIGGITGGTNPARWDRIWYWDITDAGTAYTVDVTFDISAGGMGNSVTTQTASNYKLLYRAGQSGNWTMVATASAVAGDQIIFSNYQPTNGDGYYTIASLDWVASPLPVSLLYFNATPENNHVILDWETETETNNALFEIERSADGRNFTSVLQTAGAGNSLVPIHYELTDYNLPEGIYYYRLKQIDFDDHFSYSAIRSVTISDDETLFFIYPQPVDAGASLKFHFSDKSTENIAATIFSPNGQLIAQQHFEKEESGQYSFSVDTDCRWQSGIYLLSIYDGKNYFTKRFLVK